MQHYRTGWISDVHLGTRGAQADALLAFLKANEFETLYVVGDRDIVYNFPRAKEATASLSRIVPNLTKTIIFEGCGHWTQQERPSEVNAAIIDFIRSLPN